MRDSASGGALTEVTFYILLALCEPRHGYAVMQFVAERTGGRLELGAGTLYGALGTLEKRGWIRACGGHAAARAELERLRTLAATAEEILEGVNCNGEIPVLRTDAEGAGEVAEQDGAPGLATC